MQDFATLSPAAAFFALLFGYGLGSIPFGLILTRLAGTADIRTIGSKNIGATNVLRTGRKDLAIATLLLDALKGTVAVLIAQKFGLGTGILAGAGAFLGHVFPLWLKFQGGKGVATFIGVLIALNWVAALTFALIWIGFAVLFRYSSLAALVASLSVVVIYGAIDVLRNGALSGANLVLAFMVALLWWKHKENISRLINGTEGKIGQKG